MSFGNRRKERYTTKDFEEWVPKESEYPDDGLDDELREQLKEERKAYKEELLQDFYDVILRHKKEIKKVPQCSTMKGAQEWARKRRLVAKNVDLDGDNTKEIVVFDKKGNPFVVNGYKLAPSDYPIRKMYYKEHDTPEKRINKPMREWLRESVYTYDKDPENPWRVKNIKTTELGDKLSKYGFKMPAKPKKEQSPYSIFSKLIAPLVKNIYYSERFQERLGIQNVVDGNEAYPKVLSKIISPITMYRFLYLRLVVQKHFFTLYDDDKLNYKEYARMIKLPQYKSEFTEWFFDNIVDVRTGEFNPNMVNEGLIITNLIKDDVDWDGKDFNDGIVHLLGGVKNTKDQKTTVFISGTGSDRVPNYFVDIITDDNAAHELLDILNDRNDPQHRQARAAIAKFKQQAADYIKDKYFSDAGLLKMMNDPKEYARANNSLEATNGKSMNVPDEDALEAYVESGGSTSPTKEKPTDEGQSADDAELKRFEEE